MTTATNLSVGDQIAQELTRSHTDVNELAKAFAYLRTHKNGAQFFKLLEKMVTDGNLLVRSGRTLDYYREIRRVCDKYLRAYRDKPDEMAQILGWAIRLMRYHQAAPAPAAGPVAAPPRVKPIARLTLQQLQVGMELEGAVTGIQAFGAFVDIGLGRDLQGMVHISELSSKRVARVEDVLRVGQAVKVKVLRIEKKEGRTRIALTMKDVAQA